MNILFYGFLGFLLNEFMFGYDLMLKMNLFWYIRYSYIYFLFVKLEEDGYVSFILVK